MCYDNKLSVNDNYLLHLMNNINISPNPADEYIEINLDRWFPASNWSQSESIEIKIFNTFGECLINYEFQITNYGENIEMNIEQLPVGIYFIRIGDFVKKLLIVR